MPEDNRNSRILVTGANGFVGQRLVSALLQQEYNVICAQRNDANKKEKKPGCEYYAVGDFTEMSAWDDVLGGVDSVVHLAARVHVMQETVADPLAAFRKANVEVTLKLAGAAAKKKVRRFVYISTIKVNGEQTEENAFTEKDALNPVDPYARSKFEAEQGLMDLGGASGMEIVIIRPVLVYGPGVKGNVFRLLQLIEKGTPLPFRGVNNQRSLLALDNLIDLIILCSQHPAAANQIFLATDGNDISTERLVKLCADSMHRPPRLFGVPVMLRRILTCLSPRLRKLERRLYGSLQADSSKARTLLGWRPPKSVEQGLLDTVNGYLNR
ncbi:MAG TPA: NAD-dependent epimerase/dehydratase family protein [Gammaproteobacteria bacterium]|nr:NAD-dependent epimerase/dehydratase family protein [Gammaproteobacteria bacterium]